MTKRRIRAEPVRRWTPAEDAVLRSRYANERTSDLLPQLPRRTVQSVYVRAQLLGIKKSEEFFASPAAYRLDGVTGTATRFKKGQVPWSKGKKIGTRGRAAETQFRKGERQGIAVKLWKPIGTERISKDGYLQRKINNDLPLQRRWRGVHLLIWEEANGPLPAGHALAFKNGDKADIRLDNLELIPRADLMRRNTIHNYPQPIPELLQLKGALTRKLNRRARSLEEQA